jgi:hypothetical protein
MVTKVIGTCRLKYKMSGYSEAHIYPKSNSKEIGELLLPDIDYIECIIEDRFLRMLILPATTETIMEFELKVDDDDDHIRVISALFPIT